MRRLLLGVLASGVLGGCITAPPPPPAPPVGRIYVALGTEPFWRLTINPQEMVFTEANAPGVQIAQPTPRVIIAVAGEVYQTPRIGVNIVHARCSDGMSDRVYPDTVQVRVDGRSFEGCGGRVARRQGQALTATPRRSAAGLRRPVR